MPPEKEQEYREEAERLAKLPVADQRAVIAMHREIAAGKGVPKADRQAGRERADALERFLGLAKKKAETIATPS